MWVSVVVSICHVLLGEPQVCRETIVGQSLMPAHSCIVSQAAVADWKSKSIFAGEQWTIGRTECKPADYVVKDST